MNELARFKGAREPGIAGGVLTGGESRRMGTPKDAVLLWDGRSMLAHVAGVVWRICRPVIIVGRPPTPVAGVVPYDYYLADATPGSGPLGGVATLLASGLAGGYLVAACDQPLLTTDLLRLLIAGDVTVGRCFRAADGRDYEPLPGYFPASWSGLAATLLADGEFSLRALFRAGGADVVPLSVYDTYFLFNVNSPREAEQVCRRRPILK